MTYITITEVPGGSYDTYEATLAEVGDEPVDGLQARFAGYTDEGTLCIVAAFASRAHEERFRADRLGPALARVLSEADRSTAQNHICLEPKDEFVAACAGAR